MCPEFKYPCACFELARFIFAPLVFVPPQNREVFPRLKAPKQKACEINSQAFFFISYFSAYTSNRKGS